MELIEYATLCLQGQSIRPHKKPSDYENNNKYQQKPKLLENACCPPNQLRQGISSHVNDKNKLQFDEKNNKK